MRRILSTERQRELVQDYQNGVRRVDLSDKYDLDPQQIYAYLRKNGVRPNRNPRKAYYCLVCGIERPLPPYSPNHIWRSTPTCGDIACKSIMLFHPELRLRPLPPSAANRPPFRTPEPYIMWDEVEFDDEAHKEITRLDAAELASLQEAFLLAEDERGKDLPEASRRSLWGRLSEMVIAVHLRATQGAETSVRLVGRDPHRSFLKQFFGGDSETTRQAANAFDVLYLWRCSCPQQQVYVVKRLDDLPTEEGDYGVCTTCSAAALEIRGRDEAA